jgi:hypothetical protein
LMRSTMRWLSLLASSFSALSEGCMARRANIIDASRHPETRTMPSSFRRTWRRR